jgi:hypothetical protein
MAFGENDLNCPVRRSMEIKKNEKFDNFTVKVYSSSGHGLINSSGTNVRNDFLTELSDFILKKEGFILKIYES